MKTEILLNKVEQSNSTSANYSSSDLSDALSNYYLLYKQSDPTESIKEIQDLLLKMLPASTVARAEHYQAAYELSKVSQFLEDLFVLVALERAQKDFSI